jgi:glyoxylase-like metal-dependent hydrolase (beta-lactamase superfamily II)
VSHWFITTPAAPGVFLTTEPHVNSFFRANCYTVLGRDADLQFDFGSGLLPYRPALPLTGAPVLAVASHAHIDHVGGFHEFATRLGHAAEAAGFADMNDTSTLKHLFRDQAFGPSLTQPPHSGFRLADWTLTPAPLTGLLAEGDRIDLGSRTFTVLHLPGHSPGGIGLLDEHAGLLLAGDAVYDDDLLDDIPGASVPDYLATMTRLLTLDCRLVLAGHGAPFDQSRLRSIARTYIRSKD